MRIGFLSTSNGGQLLFFSVVLNTFVVLIYILLTILIVVAQTVLPLTSQGCSSHILSPFDVFLVVFDNFLGKRYDMI